MMVGGLAFLVLFPLFFVYHYGAAQAWFPLLLGGLFGPATIVFLAPLLFGAAVLINRQPLFVRAGGSPVFVALLLWSFLWLFGHVVVDPSSPAHAQLLATLVTWMALFSLGILLPLNSRLFTRLSWISWGLIASMCLFGAQSASLMITSGIEGTATYQGLARSMAVTSCFVVATASRLWLRIAVALLSVVSLFVIGARSELYGFIGAYLAVEFLLNRKSLGGRLSLIAALSLVALLVTTNLDVLSSSRQLQVLRLTESSSWMARDQLNDVAIQQILRNPFSGAYGGHWTFGSGGDYAHNALSAWVSLGLIGFALYVGLGLLSGLASLRALTTTPTSRVARMSALMNVSTLLLIVLAKPMFWVVPPLAWGLAVLASVERRQLSFRHAPQLRSKGRLP